MTYPLSMKSSLFFSKAAYVLPAYGDNKFIGYFFIVLPIICTAFYFISFSLRRKIKSIGLKFTVCEPLPTRQKSKILRQIYAAKSRKDTSMPSFAVFSSSVLHYAFFPLCLLRFDFSPQCKNFILGYSAFLPKKAQSLYRLCAFFDITRNFFYIIFKYFHPHICFYKVSLLCSLHKNAVLA